MLPRPFPLFSHHDGKPSFLFSPAKRRNPYLEGIFPLAPIDPPPPEEHLFLFELVGSSCTSSFLPATQSPEVRLMKAFIFSEVHDPFSRSPPNTGKEGLSGPIPLEEGVWSLFFISGRVT